MTGNTLLPDRVLKTRLRVLPLLLCMMSTGVMAAAMPPLQVAPELIRGEAVPALPAATPARKPADAVRPAAATAVEIPPAPAPVSAPAPVPVPASGTAPATAPVSASVPASAPVSAAVGGMPAPASAPDELTDPAAVAQPGTTEVRARRIRGTRAVELVAEGEVELQRDDLTLTADRLNYRELSDEVSAEGQVHFQRGSAEVSGPRASLVLGERTGRFEAPAYAISTLRPGARSGDPMQQISGSGHAEAMDFEGENQYRLRNATWSTCKSADPDWYLKAQDLQLDYDREIGTSRGSTVVFKDMPIFWMPWAEFPLSGQRQSGLLPPTFGSSTETGLDLAMPYYWNIAPNYDATLVPRFLGQRGLQLGGEFRYLGEQAAGSSRIEWLPGDRMTGEDRVLGSLQHQQWLTPTLYGALDLNAVSDDTYFRDLSSNITMASRVNLLRQGQLSYTGGSWWSASALVQSYQTLNADPEDRYVTPYRRMPQLLLNALRPDLAGGLSLAFDSEYVRFEHPDEDKPTGTRVTAYPQVSLPLQGAGYFLTPKLGLHQTRYELENNPTRNSINRSVPITSLDAGLIFEREAQYFGSDFIQTLEPRLYYLNVPDRAQDDIPLFDTSRYDFGFAQIFSENRYAGGDRIADANDLTAAVSTRLIDPATGGERIRMLVGQRYYFDGQSVRLNEAEPFRTSRHADLLGGVSGRLSRTTSIESLLQYNPDQSETERFNAAVRYQPEMRKALNLSYRYARSLPGSDGMLGLRDVDLSAQWPLSGQWYGVTRMTHSLKEDRLTEALGGLEYDGGCWVFRVAMHRFAIDRDDTNKAVFLQLELNDLASIGSSPLGLIKRSVPGYGKINDPAAGRVFGNE